MPNLSAIYDDRFFAEWGRGNEAYVESARLVTNAIYDMFRP